MTRNWNRKPTFNVLKVKAGSNTMTTQARNIAGTIGYLWILAIFAGVIVPALL